MRHETQDASGHPQQRRAALEHSAKARTGGIVGRHQAAPPRPRPQDRIPEVAQGVGLPCVSEDHRRDEASLARSSRRPANWRCGPATLALEVHMGSDAPPERLFLRSASTRAMQRFENHQAFAPAHLRQFGGPYRPTLAAPLPAPHGSSRPSIAGSKSPFMTPAESPSKLIEPVGSLDA